MKKVLWRVKDDVGQRFASAEIEARLGGLIKFKCHGMGELWYKEDELIIVPVEGISVV